MRLTSLYTVEQLAAALVREYGKEGLLKTTERKNAEGEDVIEVTIVKPCVEELSTEGVFTG